MYTISSRDAAELGKKNQLVSALLGLVRERVCVSVCVYVCVCVCVYVCVYGLDGCPRARMLANAHAHVSGGNDDVTLCMMM